MISLNKVTGTRSGKHSIMLYALSTCVWCKKTKRLLNDLGLAYQFIDVDELSGGDKAEVMKELGKFGLGYSFPTMIIDSKEYIVGYKEDQIKEALL